MRKIVAAEGLPLEIELGIGVKVWFKNNQAFSGTISSFTQNEEGFPAAVLTELSPELVRTGCPHKDGSPYTAEPIVNLVHF